MFDAPSLGIQFVYPADWAPRPDPKATVPEALHVVAPAGNAELTLTVPKLPFHFGIILIGLVASGYADEVHKRMPDAIGPDAQPVAIPNAQARRVTLTGHGPDGKVATADAVLIVHNDRVYVLDADSDAAGRPAAAAALDGAVASLRWAP